MTVCDVCEFKNPVCEPCVSCGAGVCSDHGHMTDAGDILCHECFKVSDHNPEKD